MKNGPLQPLRLAILPDFLEERWPSMDLCAEMLAGELQGREGVSAELFRPEFTARLSRLSSRTGLWNADRLWNRMRDYPRQVRAIAGRFDVFHLVDHSYSQLLHELPAGRAGVFCHDLDTFACLLEPRGNPRPAWFRRMARRILSGFQSAAVVFYSTDAIRQQIIAHGLIDPVRLVKAPPGVAGEFLAPVEDVSIRPLMAGPYILHVGSCIPRKRVDVLLAVFDRVRRSHPDLRLVQVGGTWTGEQLSMVQQAPTDRITQVRGLSRRGLAWLYHNARAVLLPSAAEGFGLPVVEALAAGAPVIASDLPVLREVAGPAAMYAPVGDVEAWFASVDSLLAGTSAPPDESCRRRQVAAYSWSSHAGSILQAYRRLAA